MKLKFSASLFLRNKFYTEVSVSESSTYGSVFASFFAIIRRQFCTAFNLGSPKLCCKFHLKFLS